MTAEEGPADSTVEGPADGSDEGADVGSLRPNLGRRRRENASNQTRDVVQKIYLTAAEREELRERAQVAGVSVPRLLVEAAFSDQGETTTQRRQTAVGLFALHRELSGAAVNMNQVAKKANTVHEVPAEFGATMAALRVVADKLEAAVDVLIEANRAAGA